MNQSAIDLSSFVFRNLFRGLFWSAIGALVAIWIIMFVFMFMSVFVAYPGGEYTVTSILSGVAYVLFETTIFTIMGFIVLGIPVMILPCTVSVLLLTIWSYYDFKKSRLSNKVARLKGGILGGIAGVASLFVPMKFFAWPYLWMSFINENDTYILFWVILILIPSAGVITGSYFGLLLFKELERKGDYFLMDWESLQKEEQQNNPTLNTSNDT